MLSGGWVDGRHRRLPTHPQHSLGLPDRVYTKEGVIATPRKRRCGGA